MSDHGSDGPADRRLANPFQVGDWLVHPTLNRMTRGEETVQVEPRIIRVLECLASHPGEVVTRDSLLQIVWGDAVVGEETLTVTISELRRIFGDNPKSPRYVETIRKSGYRLIAPVVFSDVSAQSEPARPIEGSSNCLPVQSRQVSTVRAQRVIGVIVPVVAVIAALAVLFHLSRTRTQDSSVVLQGRPFTSFPGMEQYPALSPDGTQVAFSWTGGEGSNYDIYVKQQNAASPLRLTDHPANEYGATWSPDGSTIAFVRRAEKTGLYTVPSIGGSARKLIHTETEISGLDWSPDAGWLAYSAGTEPGEFPRIGLLSLDSLTTQWITSPAPGHACDFDPSFSPDGRTIAFLRSLRPAFQHDVYLIPVAGGDAQRLTFGQRLVAGIDWTPDGRDVVFAAAPTGKYQLWRVSIDDGAIVWLPTRGERVLHPSLAQQGGNLVYEQSTFDYNIWSFRLDGSAREDSLGIPLINSTQMDYAADYSPDGSRLVFLSTRSGSAEIWTSNVDGTSPRQLTRFEGTYLESPRWSPDARQIAFTAFPEGYAGVFVIDAEGGVSRRLGPEDRHERFGTWSSDGQWIYFNYGGHGQIWRMRNDGTERQPVIDDGTLVVCEMAGGEHLLHFRSDVAGIWRTSLEDGTQECVVHGDSMVRWLAWTAEDEGIYYVLRQTGSRSLEFYDFSTKESRVVQAVLGFRGSALTVSPDGKTFLYERADHVECDLILVDSFS